jgi:hypothetical protein
MSDPSCIKLPFRFFGIMDNENNFYKLKTLFIDFIKNELIPYVNNTNSEEIDEGYTKLIEYVNISSLPITFRLNKHKTSFIIKNFCFGVNYKQISDNSENILEDVQDQILYFNCLHFHFILSNETSLDNSHFMYVFPKILVEYGQNEDYICYNLIKRDGSISLHDIQIKIMNNIKFKNIKLDWKKMDYELKNDMYMTKTIYHDPWLNDYTSDSEFTCKAKRKMIDYEDISFIPDDKISENFEENINNTCHKKFKKTDNHTPEKEFVKDLITLYKDDALNF